MERLRLSFSSRVSRSMCRKERRWRSTGYGRHFFTQCRQVKKKKNTMEQGVVFLSEGKWVTKWRQAIMWVNVGMQSRETGEGLVLGVDTLEVCRVKNHQTAGCTLVSFRLTQRCKRKNMSHLPSISPSINKAPISLKARCEVCFHVAASTTKSKIPREISSPDA